MNMATSSGTGIAVVNLQEFFHDSVQHALKNQHVEVQAQTEHYLVTVLTRFAHADEYYERGTEGRGQRPLACLLADALAAPEPTLQRERMQRLGDVSLFMAGFFAQSFARKLVAPTAIWPTAAAALRVAPCSRCCSPSWPPSSSISSMC